MSIPAADVLRELASRSDYPSISIYMPVFKSGKEIRQNPTRLRNLLRQAERSMENDERLDKAQIAALLEPARPLAGDRDFWLRQEKGLALFLADGLLRTFELPVSVKDLAFVGRHFYLRPLLVAAARKRDFHVLALNPRHVQLFECSGQSVTPASLGDAPTRFLDFVGSEREEQHLQWHTRAPAAGGPRAAVFHGQGGGTDDVKPEIRKFLQAVDAGVKRALGGTEAPLVLAGLEQLVSIYRDTSGCQQLAPDEVRIDAATLTPEALREEAWKIVQPLFDRERQEAVEALEAALGKGTGASNPEEILPAAHDGRVEVLLMARGKKLWGVYDPASRDIQLREGPGQGVDELFDLAAIETFRHGGMVHETDARDLSAAGGSMGALYRY